MKEKDFSKVHDILTADTDSLVELAKIGGMDHRTCYRGADFRGADLTDEDLTQFDLTHAVLDGCTLTDEQREYCVSMGYLKNVDDPE